MERSGTSEGRNDPAGPSESAEPLIIVSNRGPAHFDRGPDGERTVTRGGGGLVTALSGLVADRDALWIASAMSAEDIAVTEENNFQPIQVDLDRISCKVLMVESDPEAYDRFYSVIANPILWFIQHYLWDLSNAPDISMDELEAWYDGYEVVNDDIALAVIDQIAGRENPLVLLHDYHLYTAPAKIRRARPDALLHHFVHIPWTQPDSWRVLPTRIREAIYNGLLANDMIGFHTSSYCVNFLACCHSLMGYDVDYDTFEVTHPGGRTRVHAYPLSIDSPGLIKVAESEPVLEAEKEILARRREHLILRVDRADLSKNVLRGFTAFDTFLEGHPEFRERVTFVAHLQPSRQDVPEYREYLERIEALVAVVNHRHGTTDWMPIDLRVYENFIEAVARYKHYDLLMVNAIFDGMNLVAKEAPIINLRDGVVMLSENTGSHQELKEHVLTVNPFDIQDQADAIYHALTMSPEERHRRADGLRKVINSRTPGDWIDDQLADIEAVRWIRDAQ